MVMLCLQGPPESSQMNAHPVLVLLWVQAAWLPSRGRSQEGRTGLLTDLESCEMPGIACTAKGCVLLGTEGDGGRQQHLVLIPDPVPCLKNPAVTPSSGNRVIGPHL